MSKTSDPFDTKQLLGCLAFRGVSNAGLPELPSSFEDTYRTKFRRIKISADETRNSKFR